MCIRVLITSLIRANDTIFLQLLLIGMLDTEPNRPICVSNFGLYAAKRESQKKDGMHTNHSELLYFAPNRMWTKYIDVNSFSKGTDGWNVIKKRKHNEKKATVVNGL